MEHIVGVQEVGWGGGLQLLQCFQFGRTVST
jgi:hypothetical protein